jgi:hydrolase, TatD family
MDKILFDSHSHINYERYRNTERSDVMDRIESSQVAFVVDVGFNVESSRQAVLDAEARPWCYAAVGVHPHDAEIFTDNDFSTLCLLTNHPKVMAFGEIGLDFYRDFSPRDKQREVFRKQLRFALENGLPIIIHDRDSAGETINILAEEGAFSQERKAAFPPNPVTGIPDARILLHCFSGSAQQALEYIDFGCTISIAGPVTYKNNKRTVQVAKLIPLSHMLIETDSPYLTPEPFRGKQNDSTNVEYVARKVAEIRDISYEELATATLKNAKRFFGI